MESFSAVSHCCRYCLIPKGDLTNGKISPMWHEPRNADNYIACVQENSRTGETHCKGVKRDSVLNQLQYFHVTDPGLPPCLGHDLFEGVIKVDLTLILNILKERGYISYEGVNVRIEMFKFKGTEALEVMQCSASMVLFENVASAHWR